LHAIGPAGGPPTIPLNLVGDLAGGSLFLTIGILAALAERVRSRRGQVIDAAIVDGTASLLSHVCGFYEAGLWSETRGANLVDGGTPWYSTYETSDGEHMAIGPIEPQFYAELLARLGLDAARVPGQWEKEGWPELRAALAAKFRERTREEWTEFFSGTNACVAPILKLSEAASHPHLAARGTFLHEHGALQPAPAPRFSRTPTSVERPPCRPGQHTREVLREANVSYDEILELESSGAVGDSRD
jgi:alpha-methylacyl-CoA racemase